MKALAVGIAGCAGRMGRMVIAEVLASPDLRLAGGCEQTINPAIGQDVAAQAGFDPAGVFVGDEPAALFKAADVVVDFTSPAAALAHARLASKTGTALVIGTTGLDKGHLESLRKAAKKAVVVQAANMSAAVNLLLGLTEQAAAALGPDYDIEIVEMHHRMKVDAPSGTALALGEAAARGRKVKLETVSERGRDGITGARRKGAIGFAALRGGDVAGEHKVIFAGLGERLELGHLATTRQVFAKGAILAVRWTRGRKPGFYSMRDVLGMKPETR